MHEQHVWKERVELRSVMNIDRCHLDPAWLSPPRSDRVEKLANESGGRSFGCGRETSCELLEPELEGL
jgi:hypothetical protein